MSTTKENTKKRAILRFIELSEPTKSIKISSHSFNKNDYNKKRYLTRSEKYERANCLRILETL